MFKVKKSRHLWKLSAASIAVLSVLSPFAHAGATGSVGNRVWIDDNANGIQDKGESGAADVKVTLMQCDSKSEMQATTTNKNGIYSFGNLEADVKYQLAVFPNSSAATTGATTSPYKQGSRRGRDSNLIESTMTTGDPFHSDCFSIKDGQIKNSVDMGLVVSSKPPTAVDGTIGDHVFIDRDGNGLFTAGEGVQGATVKAYDASGNVVASMMTNSSGFYQLNVPEGCYRLEAELPSSIDSSTVIYDSTLDNVCVSSGQNNDTADFLLTEVVIPEKPVLQCSFEIYSVHVQRYNKTTKVIVGDWYTTSATTRIWSDAPFSLDSSTIVRAYTSTGSLIYTSDRNLPYAAPYPYILGNVKDDTDTGGIKVGTYIPAYPGAHDGGYYYSNDPNAEWIVFPHIIAIAKFPSMKYVVFSYADGSESEKINCTMLPPRIQNNIVGTPIVLDMNGDGSIGVSGLTTSPIVVRSSTNLVAKFDYGDGVLRGTEWLVGDGDAILVDNRDGKAAQDMSGKRLFGDDQGRFVSGYDKLALLDENTDGVISGDELSGLALWYDNGDAVVQDGELRPVQSSDIASIDANYQMVEGMMRSTASLVNGKKVMTEDVWFAIDGIASPIAQK